MKNYRVKQNFSIGKDTYDVFEGEKKIFSVKGKMIELMGKSFDILDEGGKSIAKLSGGISKNSWELLQEEKEKVAQYNFSSWGRGVKAKVGEKMLKGKRRRGKIGLTSEDGMSQIVVYKTFGLMDEFTVEATEDIEVLPATMLAIAIDQKYFENGGEKRFKGSIFNSLLRMFLG